MKKARQMAGPSLTHQAGQPMIELSVLEERITADTFSGSV
jgi:hypothetical protein